MEWLAEYGLFFAKTATVVLAVLVIMAAAVANAMRHKKPQQGAISIVNINKDLEKLRDEIQHAVLDKETLKQLEKDRKKQQKQERKARKKALKAQGQMPASQEGDAEPGGEEKTEDSALEQASGAGDGKEDDKRNSFGLSDWPAEDDEKGSEQDDREEGSGGSVAEKGEGKAADPQAGEADGGKKRLYVMDFEGDLKASQVDGLRQTITAILEIARPGKDEVLLRLESPGGMVHAYGLAASQLNRLRKKGVFLTVCVDKVAASGGYLMACLGNRIMAAPFAYIGSIGVLLQLPNFNRLLKKKEVDYEMITSGEYKRTLTLFGENTDKGREKAAAEIQEVHGLFKDFVREYRPSLDIDRLATGETWLGTKALELGLVDELLTSDECIVRACEEAEAYFVSYQKKANLKEKFSHFLESAMASALSKWLRKLGGG